MKVAIGSDHGGFRLKAEISAYLAELGYQVVDHGTHDEASCDYPDIGKVVAEAIAAGEQDLGILICGTGLGMSMAANKVTGVIAAACSDVFSAEMARAHNDANILTFGERVVGPGLAKKLVKVFMETPFEGGRHARRVGKIRAIEAQYMK